MPTMLDLIRQIQRGELPPPPVATLVGFQLTAVEPGHAVVEFQARERHANPMGTLHGGVLCDIADAAMGMAWASTLDEGERSEEHTSELQSQSNLVCRLLLEKKNLVEYSGLLHPVRLLQKILLCLDSE